jgi:hypothetical protein
MIGSMDVVQGNLTSLQQLDWIDRRTRSVFLEFTVFNPNIGLFSVSQILFELLPTGNMIRSHRFEVISLLTDLSDNALNIAAGIILMFLVLFLMLVELKKMYRKKREYLRSFEWINNWLLIVFAWTAFGVYLFRIYESYRIKVFFRESNGFGFINLQHAS